MKSILRNTIILSGSSFVSVAVGLVSAKVWALLMGPSGIGYLGLLQGLIGLIGLLAGMGVGAGLISAGARTLAAGDRAGFAALRKAGWLLFWAAGGLAVLIMVLLRVPISRVMLGGPEHAGDVVLMSVALLFSLAYGVQVSLLNAHHRVSALARVGALNSLLSTAVSLLLVWLLRERGIAWAVIGGSAAGWAVSAYFLQRETGGPRGQARAVVTRPALVAATRSLLHFGPSYAMSQVLSSGVQFALPALVLAVLGIDNVGFYRSAISVAGVYLGFLLVAMGQDYFPRLSAVSDQPRELGRLVNQQHRLAMLIAIPMILTTMAVAPYLVHVIYSPAFAPAVGVLEWLLIGDIFKFSSWSIGFVVLARRRGRTLFLVELLAGVNFLWTAVVGMRWLGLEGVGVGQVLTYIIHFAVVWAIVRREIGLELTTENKLMLLAGAAAALVIRTLPLVGLEQFKTPVALVLAVLAAAFSVATLWQEIDGWRYLREWRQRI